MAKGSTLTEKQRRFCEEYLVDFNATEAARRAGYTGTSIAKQAHLLMKHPLISAVIEKTRLQINKKREISRERILDEIAKCAFSNVADFAKWNPSGLEHKSSDELDRDQTAAISEITEHTNQHGGSIRIKLHDKLKALELLGKHVRLFEPDVDNSRFDPVVIQMPMYNQQVIITDKKEEKVVIDAPQDPSA